MAQFVLGLFGNHIVGFPTRQLTWRQLTLDLSDSDVSEVWESDSYVVCARSSSANSEFSSMSDSFTDPSFVVLFFTSESIGLHVINFKDFKLVLQMSPLITAIAVTVKVIIFLVHLLFIISASLLCSLPLVLVEITLLGKN